MRGEKTRLATRLDAETVRLQSSRLDQENELTSLRQAERKASSSAAKWKKAYDFQRVLLQKRIEQHMVAKSKIRVLLGVLRKYRVAGSSPLAGINLDSPSWRLAQGSASPLVGPSRLGSRTISAEDLASTDTDEADSKAPPGRTPAKTVVTRTTLTVSPLLGTRRGFFTQLADAAVHGTSSFKGAGEHKNPSFDSVE